GGGHVPGQARRDPAIAGGVGRLLAHLAHAPADHVVDHARVDAGALDERLERDGEQVVGMEGGKRTVAPADRRAHGVDDDGLAGTHGAHATWDVTHALYGVPLCQDRAVPTGISEEHVELHRTARRWADARCAASVPRALLEAEVETLPPFWDELVELGWTRLAVDFGLVEAAIVVEELGRAVAPGPILPTVLASVVLSEGGAADLIGPAAAVGLASGAPVLGGGTAEVFVLPSGDGWAAFTPGEVEVQPRASVD